MILYYYRKSLIKNKKYNENNKRQIMDFYIIGNKCELVYLF